MTITAEMVVDAIMAYNHWDDALGAPLADLRAEAARQVRSGEGMARDMKRALIAAVSHPAAA